VSGAKGLRDELEALFGAGQGDQVGNEPSQAVAEDHLQLHRKLDGNV